MRSHRSRSMQRKTAIEAAVECAGTRVRGKTALDTRQIRDNALTEDHWEGVARGGLA